MGAIIRDGNEDTGAKESTKCHSVHTSLADIDDENCVG